MESGRKLCPQVILEGARRGMLQTAAPMDCKPVRDDPRPFNVPSSAKSF
ncbi:MAG TPA: hypothetical protein PLL88_05440 [Anaerolineaceae bacterium]|nr:hypothetical protein [Anaerolineaceae bacterium]